MKLTYFKAPARAEPARLMLGVTKTAYTDVNIGREDWQALKPKTKYGQVPVLELNDGRQLAQVRSSDDRAHSVTNQSEQAMISRGCCQLQLQAQSCGNISHNADCTQEEWCF